MKTTNKELRDFGLIMAVGLIALFGLFFPWLGDRAINITGWPWIAGAVFAVFGLLAPRALYWPNKIWMKIGHVLGWINSRIILGLVYFLLFTPMALVRRLLGKDSLNRQLDASAKSYRTVSSQPKTENLEKPF